MTLLLQLRDAAKTERDELVRYNLKLIADELDGACTRFATDPTTDNLTAVNGHWVHGVRMLDFASKRGGSGGSGVGLKEGALLTEAA